MAMKPDRRSFLAAIAAFAAHAAAARPVPATAAGQDLTTEEFDLIRSVNTMRRDRGLQPLTLRRDLSRAARAYARRMAEEGFFSHHAPDGAGPTDRADAEGYDWRRLGEALAAGQPTADETAKSWRDSPGHAKIIFDPDSRHIGVGFWRRRNLNPKRPTLERYWVLLAGDTR